MSERNFFKIGTPRCGVRFAYPSKAGANDNYHALPSGQRSALSLPKAANLVRRADMFIKGNK